MVKGKKVVPVVFCNIVKYIEYVDPLLYNVIHNNLCMTQCLTLKKGSGVTFLHPHKIMRDEIIKLSYSPDAKKAYTMLTKCIIPQYLPELNSFTDDIKTISGDVITIIEKSSETLTLNNGFIIKKDNNFKLLHLGTKYAVYNIVSKPPTLGNTEMSSSSMIVGGAPAGYAKQWAESGTDKVDIRNLVIDSMFDGESKNLALGKSKIKPLMDSLLTYTETDHPEEYKNICDQVPLHYAASPFLVAWVIQYNITAKWAEADDKHTPRALSSFTGCADDANKDAWTDVRNKVQAAILKDTSSSMYDNVHNAYKAAFSGGSVTIGGTEFTFPALASGSTFPKSRKYNDADMEDMYLALLAHHECMHYTSFIGDKVPSDATALLMSAKKMFLSGSGPKSWIADSKSYKAAVGSRVELLCLLIRFVCSECFLYRRCCVEQYTGTATKGSMRPDSIVAYNNSKKLISGAAETTCSKF